MTFPSPPWYLQIVSSVSETFKLLLCKITKYNLCLFCNITQKCMCSSLNYKWEAWFVWKARTHTHTRTHRKADKKISADCARCPWEGGAGSYPWAQAYSKAMCSMSQLHDQTDVHAKQLKGTGLLDCILSIFSAGLPTPRSSDLCVLNIGTKHVACVFM